MLWQSLTTWFRNRKAPTKKKPPPRAEPNAKPTDRRILLMVYALCTVVLVIDAYAVYRHVSRGQSPDCDVSPPFANAANRASAPPTRTQGQTFDAKRSSTLYHGRLHCQLTIQH